MVRSCDLGRSCTGRVPMKRWPLSNRCWGSWEKDCNTVSLGQAYAQFMLGLEVPDSGKSRDAMCPSPLLCRGFSIHSMCPASSAGPGQWVSLGWYLIPTCVRARPEGHRKERARASTQGLQTPLWGEKESPAAVHWWVGKALSAMPQAENLRFYFRAPKPSRKLPGNSQLRVNWHGNGTELRTNIAIKLFCCGKPSLLYYPYFSTTRERTTKKRLGEVRQLYGFSFPVQIIDRTSNDQDRSRVLNIALDFDRTIWWLIFSFFLKQRLVVMNAAFQGNSA